MFCYVCFTTVKKMGEKILEGDLHHRTCLPLFAPLWSTLCGVCVALGFSSPSHCGVKGDFP